MSDLRPTEHEHVQTTEPTREPSAGLTGYAAVKYGFILLTVIAVLYFAAVYAIPALTGN